MTRCAVLRVAQLQIDGEPAMGAWPRPGDTLANAEGPMWDRLAAWLCRSGAGLGGVAFPLAAPVKGWWDRSGAEVDLAPQDADHRRIRVGSCERSGDNPVADLGRLEGYIARIATKQPELMGWTVEKVVSVGSGS